MAAVTEYLKSLVAPLLALAAVTYGTGKLLLEVSHVEPSLSRDVAADRTGLWNGLTELGSSLSDTPYIVALTVIAAIVFRLAYGRWRESVFLALAVWAQSLIFLATTNLVGRHRPPVEHLDPAPPTSSFPSGHVSAAVAFYCGVALVLTTHHHRSRLLTAAIWAVGLGAPLAVAFSRIYRGMHFVTDVLWGILLGGVCLAVVARAVLFSPSRRRPSVPRSATAR